MSPLKSIYKHPEEWTANDYYFIHKGGVKIYIAHGPLAVNFKPYGGMSFFNKFRYWNAFKWWVNNMPVDGYKVKSPKKYYLHSDGLKEAPEDGVEYID